MKRILCGALVFVAVLVGCEKKAEVDGSSTVAPVAENSVEDIIPVEESPASGQAPAGSEKPVDESAATEAAEQQPADRGVTPEVRPMVDAPSATEESPPVAAAAAAGSSVGPGSAATKGAGVSRFQPGVPNSKGFRPFGAGEKIRTVPTRPNPMFKLMAIERVLGSAVAGKGAFWGGYFNRVQCDIDPDKYNDTKIAIPVLLGFRICDGVIAIKARDAEKLNACADDIEKLARKMGIADAKMTRARLVRSYANKGEWNRVFLELGFLQRDIEAHQTGGRDAKSLLYAAGWMQGGRYYSTVVQDHFSPALSSLLREPKFVRYLADELRRSKPAVRDDPMTVKLIGGLDTVAGQIDVPLRAALSREQVEGMFEATMNTVRSCVDSAR